MLATIVARRAPGMTMLRIAPFTWTMLVTCLMVIASFPVLVAAMGLLWVQREFGGVFNGAGGPIDYQNLFWFYGHSVVYVMFFPFVGAVAEVVSVHARRRFFGYRAFAVSLLAFTALSTSVWAHHMFTTGRPGSPTTSRSTRSIGLLLAPERGRSRRRPPTGAHAAWPHLGHAAQRFSLTVLHPNPKGVQRPRAHQAAGVGPDRG